MDKLNFPNNHSFTFFKVKRRICGILGAVKCLHAIELVEISEVSEAPSGWEAVHLTPAEIAYCSQNKRRRTEHEAARLAAKRALRKICPGADWLEMEILKDESGKPEIHFSGKTAGILKEKGVSRSLLSLSHTKETALASLILL